MHKNKTFWKWFLSFYKTPSKCRNP